LPDNLAEGEYYQTDLIGFLVIRDEKKIGTVAGFQNFGAGDIIELDNGEMVSFNAISVDLENKEIKL
ncbi:MAG: 16S rRNA processing protein RimM, partial [Alphaproteobacteria bacterium]